MVLEKIKPGEVEGCSLQTIGSVFFAATSIGQSATNVMFAVVQSQVV